MPSITDTDARFEVSDWRTFEKNTLRAFFSLILPSGMVLSGCTYHVKNESRWIGLPGQKFTKADGTVSFVPVVEFASKTARDRFQELAREAVDRHLGGAR